MSDKKTFTDEMALEALKWIVHDVTERKNEAEQEKHDDFSKGRSMAYFEVMDMIRSRLSILGVELNEGASPEAS